MFTYELTPVADVVISEEPKLKPIDTLTKADEIKDRVRHSDLPLVEIFS